MKKFATITIMLMVLISCQQSKYGRAGDNAIQYLREQMTGQMDNIESMEIIKEDSVLSSILLSFAETEFHMENVKYLNDEISPEQYRAFVDSIDRVLTDVTRSWVMDQEWGDSLKRLDKYASSWRKAFIVQVTMKSGSQSQHRVCMDQDGTTPSETEEQFTKQHNELQEALSKRLDL